MAGGVYKFGHLRGAKWCLWSVVFDGEPLGGVPGAGGNITLKEDGRAVGRGGCNHFTGYYVRDRKNIQFGPFSTRGMYSDRYKDIENAFFKALEEVRTFHIDGTLLKMFSEDHSTILVFVEHDFISSRRPGHRTVVKVRPF